MIFNGALKRNYNKFFSNTLRNLKKLKQICARELILRSACFLFFLNATDFVSFLLSFQSDFL